MTLYLSRLRVARTPQIDALKALLDPLPTGAMDKIEQGKRIDAHHRLIWSAFAGDPEAKRDFLWRDAGKGAFFTLSTRPPLDSPFFEPPDVKEFIPELRAGDALSFVLRANATKSRPKKYTPDKKDRRVDVVMDGLRNLPSGLKSDERRDTRMKIAQEAGTAWLAGQGERAGFALKTETAVVADYSVAVLPGYVGPRKGQPQYGILDISGTLEITDPAAFLTRLARGFGRAKAFGCGLMLIRRV